MTNTLPQAEQTSRPAEPARLPIRLLQSIGYDAALPPISLAALVATAVGRREVARRAWGRLLRIQQSPEPEPGRQPAAVRAIAYGALSLALGLLCWFFLFMFTMGVLRGIFYGLVTDGPYGPGTWGGPTKAGAWAVHAAVSIPILILVPPLLRGLGLLHAALVRRLYGATVQWWVLPATIAICGAGGLLFCAWIQQI